MRRLASVAVLFASSFSARAAFAEEPPAAPASPPSAPVSAERGYLGFQPEPGVVSGSDGREQMRVVIVKVRTGGPAYKAGLRAGDVLLRLAGEPVPDVSNLDPRGGDAAGFAKFLEAFQGISAKVKVGAKVELVVERHGKPVPLEATAVDKATLAAMESKESDVGLDAAERGYLGFVSAAAPLLSAEERERWKVKATQGVVATRVTKGSPAEKAGLRAGDVILLIDGQDVPSTKNLDPTDPTSAKKFAEQFAKISAKIRKGTTVTIVVERDGKTDMLHANAVDFSTMQKVAAAAGEDMGDGFEGAKKGGAAPDQPPK